MLAVLDLCGHCQCESESVTLVLDHSLLSLVWILEESTLLTEEMGDVLGSVSGEFESDGEVARFYRGVIRRLVTFV